MKLRSDVCFIEDASDEIKDLETIHHESHSLALGLTAKSFYVNWPQQIAPPGTTIILIIIRFFKQNPSHLTLRTMHLGFSRAIACLPHTELKSANDTERDNCGYSQLA